ncbi:hypothetical protein [Arthrobacter sp. StoSoilB13]|uniref:hypothetical protein n=1 Tax=Arthrobacter sp. StoSoilB13 TaxID=2830993 RepID=UPI001CC4DF8B|nr:hypothetical protein [Arthrobacter sp. StoSoilB13]BCW51092.1 hypothetical protein StoSoilB13_34340 [Arthrobacter sp. StoSoilB13]
MPNIAAARIDAEEQPPTPEDDLLPSEPARLNLAHANITSILWATGYKLDLSFIDIPVLDEWGYPKQTAGVTEQPGPVRRRASLADSALLIDPRRRGTGRGVRGGQSCWVKEQPQPDFNCGCSLP